MNLVSRVSPAWLLVFAAVWWVLTAPVWQAWGAGVMAVLGGGALHTLLGGRAEGRLVPGELLRFVPLFLALAVRGGIDVARRALSPRLRIAPGMLDHSLRLPEGPARVLFVNMLSLLPGTFSAELVGDRLTVHLLARDAGDERRIGELEQRIGRLFGIELGEPGSRGA